MNRYYFLNRPPSIGTHPAGETARESWVPRQDAQLEDEVGEYTRPVWGWVEYPQALTFEQVWKYDLIPAGKDELIRYNQWRDEEGK